jgi:hypothetical protein
MQRRSSSSVPLLALLGLLSFAAGDAGAQVVNLSGPMHDGAGGPLLTGVVYHAVAPITVPVGTTLTIAQGAILKFDAGLYGGYDLTVDGTLLVNGTPGAPVIFTSTQDDTAGGDTNRNGPSVGTPGQWRGVVFNQASDQSALRCLELRFAGGGFWSGIEVVGSDLTISGCTVRNCSGPALDLNHGPAFPSVTGCSFQDNRGVAVDGVPIDAVPGFSGNSASGNVGGNYQQVTQADPTVNRTIALGNVLNGALVFADHCDVPAGITLTLQAGVVVKIAPNLYNLGIMVQGTLRADGTAVAPVVFTALADDTYAGDTNADGPSTGSPGAWHGIYFGPASDASVLRHAIVRFAGGGGHYTSVTLDGSDLTMTGCTIERGAGWGTLNCGAGGANPSHPTVVGCSFRDNAPVAVNGLAIDAVDGFLHNTASGNAGGNYLRVDQADPATNTTIGPANLIHGVLVLADHCDVPAGVTLTFEQGTVVKVAPSLYGQGFTVNGPLRALGTGYEPVVFTSLSDDDWAGDTNNDGPSTGAPGQWSGFYFSPSPGASVLEYARIRYGAGGGHWTGVYSDSPNLRLRSVRMEYMGGWYGFRLAALSGFAENLVAFRCAGDGVWLTGGSFPLVQATVVRCGGAGIRRDPNWAGIVTGSISWGNAANFLGFVRGNVYSSNGDQALAGDNGNTFLIPNFVDEAAGDLHLQPNSALIDLANVGYSEAVARDHEENSRLLDNDINSVALPDMGAYEVAFWNMTVAGTPRIGGTLDFTVQSYAGLSVYLLGGLDGGFNLQPWGLMTAGRSPVVFAAALVGTPVRVAIPDDSGLVGLQAGIQTVTFPLSTFVYGSVTRLYRLKVRP